MKEESELQVGKLVDLKLQHAGRASNLFWLGFGDIAEIIGRGRIEKIPGNNRFDERIKAFIKNNEQIKVLQIDSDEVGGLNIILSGGYKLEAFPDSSKDDEQSEHWRLFNRKENSPHFIVIGKGIEKV